MAIGKIKRSRPATLALEDFKTPAELGLTLPALMLGIEVEAKAIRLRLPAVRPTVQGWPHMGEPHACIPLPDGQHARS